MAQAQQSAIAQRANRDSGDALAAAFELVATPALFAFFGWLIDGRLGTDPIFMLGLGIVTAAYMVWRSYVEYSAKMDALAAELPSRRTPAAAHDGASDV